MPILRNLHPDSIALFLGAMSIATLELDRLPPEERGEGSLMMALQIHLDHTCHHENPRISRDICSLRDLLVESLEKSRKNQHLLPQIPRSAVQ